MAEIHSACKGRKIRTRPKVTACAVGWQARGSPRAIRQALAPSPGCFGARGTTLTQAAPASLQNPRYRIGKNRFAGEARRFSQPRKPWPGVGKAETKKLSWSVLRNDFEALLRRLPKQFFQAGVGLRKRLLDGFKRKAFVLGERGDAVPYLVGTIEKLLRLVVVTVRRQDSATVFEELDLAGVQDLIPHIAG